MKRKIAFLLIIGSAIAVTVFALLAASKESLQVPAPSAAGGKAVTSRPAGVAAPVPVLLLGGVAYRVGDVVELSSGQEVTLRGVDVGRLEFSLEYGDGLVWRGDGRQACSSPEKEGWSATAQISPARVRSSTGACFSLNVCGAPSSVCFGDLRAEGGALHAEVSSYQASGSLAD